jgi:hypothetical protein
MALFIISAFAESSYVGGFEDSHRFGTTSGFL